MAEFVADRMGINGKQQQQQQQRPLPRTGAPLWALLDWIHPGAELHWEGRVSMATCGWRAVSCKIGGCRMDNDARHQKAAICCRRAIYTGPVVLMTQLDNCSTLFVTPCTRVDGHGRPWMMMMMATVLMSRSRSRGRVNVGELRGKFGWPCLSPRRARSRAHVFAHCVISNIAAIHTLPPFHTRLAWISITTLVARPSRCTLSDTAVSLARGPNLLALAIYCDTATPAPAHQISHG
ncbi:hypothetical protein COCMIDRAFT_39066 [Bipolaris oryzae ATCC 44560]|uniref:Uncharacterized protein n=1 Tax=Bipolaris oryzae ATCC 44560 TaxID=930090 RepID=W6YZD4_COCMI|nr:uncharacterized protein COCMIDRAFT_39066 [Bipolaris oryzae ATCC 44560]EUC42953.1 hypothetical protein COCMIDRAFT_39066 [Bipolaris oryzae ATCC 44560]